jgi:hypothetical protein
MARVTIILEDGKATDDRWHPVNVGIEFRPGCTLDKRRWTWAERIGDAIFREAIRLKEKTARKRKPAK